MSFLDYLLISFVCTAANHLGLVAAAERIVHHSLYPVSCVKCCSFWASVAYGCAMLCRQHTCPTPRTVAYTLAAAMMAAWAAIWMELAMGGIDAIYTRIYNAIYSTAADDDYTAAAQQSNHTGTDDTAHTENAVPGVRE